MYYLMRRIQANNNMQEAPQVLHCSIPMQGDVKQQQKYPGLLQTR